MKTDVSFPALLTQRQLMTIQGFEVVGGTPRAIAELAPKTRARIARGIHKFLLEDKKATLPCPDCGAPVRYEDWDLHVCDPEVRRRHQEER